MQLGELRLSADELATALELAQGQSLAYEEAQTLLAIADLARLEGRDVDADDALHEAKSLMQRVGATD